MHLLSTNDKRIKLWKVYERSVKSVGNFNFNHSLGIRVPTTSEAYTSKSTLPGAYASSSSPKGSGAAASASSFPLKVPSVESQRTVMASRCRSNYANGHLYHIHSVDANSDGETFISADDLHINLWNAAVENVSFNIVDMQPDNMDELTEVITSALFHPKHCHVLAYSSSKGSIRLGDLRSAALCDRSSKVFDIHRNPAGEASNFFSEIVANITDVKFSACGNQLVARDYLTVKLWDVRSEAKPVQVLNVQENLSPKLMDLYENDAIFDKFECAMSRSGRHVASGSYSSTLRVFDVAQGTDQLIEANTHNPHDVRCAADLASKKVKSPRFASLFSRRDSAVGGSGGAGGAGGADADPLLGDGRRRNLDLGLLDCVAKVKHVQWHPRDPLLACAVANKLYLLSNGQDRDRAAPASS